ncbi:MAG: tRNA pseudouridine(13) synthase TruD, partial [Thermoplasmata archaeon]|nr:tRNA pseudouridine(13) synthase TruD [Thermoplasmata archaeon]
LLAGYDVPLAGGRMGRVERRIVAEEGVQPEDFHVRSLPKLASRGLRRSLLAPVRDFAFALEDDVRLSFTLLPGSYATSLLREVRKGDTL